MREFWEAIYIAAIAAGKSPLEAKDYADIAEHHWLERDDQQPDVDFRFEIQ